MYENRNLKTVRKVIMIRFVKFFGITLFFILLLTVVSMYLSIIQGEGLIRPVAVVF